jgi:hypothetical protein
MISVGHTNLQRGGWQAKRDNRLHIRAHANEEIGRQSWESNAQMTRMAGQLASAQINLKPLTASMAGLLLT